MGDDSESTNKFNKSNKSKLAIHSNSNSHTPSNFNFLKIKSNALANNHKNT